MPRVRKLWALALLAIYLAVLVTMVITFLYRGVSIHNPVLDLFIAFHFEIMILVSISGLAVGGAVYWLMGEEAEHAVAASSENARLLLSLLPPGDRQVIEFLARGKGEGFQSEIARLNGMNRLRAHRILADLKRRGLVHIEQVGKLNKVFLSPSLLAALQDHAPETALARPSA